MTSYSFIDAITGGFSVVQSHSKPLHNVMNLAGAIFGNIITTDVYRRQINRLVRNDDYTFVSVFSSGQRGWGAAGSGGITIITGSNDFYLQVSGNRLGTFTPF